MRFEGVSRVQQRQEMLEAVERGELTVTEACRLWGVSRQTFYVWRRRREADGDGGLENRSSRPRRSPGRVPPLLEGRIVDMRRAHPRWGARRIRAELGRLGVDPLPARSTVHRALVRNGLVAGRRREPGPGRRFVRRRANELWQTDAKEWHLVDGTIVQVVSVLDDHSRMCGAVRAFAALSCEAAIEVFDAAAAALGEPEGVLSDRGAVFTGRSTGCVNAFERHLWAQGVCTLNGRPYHPQTQGKVERYHRTLGEWLEDHGPFGTREELDACLVAFRHDYNHARPHQALDDRTPAEAFAAAERAGPDPVRAAERCRREALRVATPTGNISYGNWQIGLGRAWGGSHVRVVDHGSVVEVRSVDGELVREVKPDYTRTYLGTGGPRGRSRRRGNV